MWATARLRPQTPGNGGQGKPSFLPHTCGLREGSSAQSTTWTTPCHWQFPQCPLVPFLWPPFLAFACPPVVGRASLQATPCPAHALPSARRPLAPSLRPQGSSGGQALALLARRAHRATASCRGSEGQGAGPVRPLPRPPWAGPSLPERGREPPWEGRDGAGLGAWASWADGPGLQVTPPPSAGHSPGGSCVLRVTWCPQKLRQGLPRGAAWSSCPHGALLS